MLMVADLCLENVMKTVVNAPSLRNKAIEGTLSSNGAWRLTESSEYAVGEDEGVQRA